MKRRSLIHKGYSLIEMMIILSLIAMVSSFAYNNWSSSLRQARKLDAQTSLYLIASTLESCFLEKQDYALCAADLPVTQLSHQRYFTIEIRESEPSRYVLIASATALRPERYQLDSMGNFYRKS